VARSGVCSNRLRLALPRRLSEHSLNPEPTAGGKAVVSPVPGLVDGISAGEVISGSGILYFNRSQIKPFLLGHSAPLCWVLVL